MSQENVELVQQMWEAFLEDDLQSALLWYDPDVEWDGKGFSDPNDALEAVGLAE
jgi:hypothetical protein